MAAYSAERVARCCRESSLWRGWLEAPCRVARCSPRLWGRVARAKVLKTASQVELRKSRRVERVNSMASRCRSRQSRIREVGLDLAARQKRT